MSFGELLDKISELYQLYQNEYMFVVKDAYKNLLIDLMKALNDVFKEGEF